MPAPNSALVPDDPPLVADSAAAPSPVPSWAVVSFLFEDAVWCDWLFREFDGERIPRQLKKRGSRFGAAYPERISVSPDPADAFQLESYAEALQSSQHLILIVSPNSAGSQMLMDHLRLFKAAGGSERIIALVVKGEPASPSADPGMPSDEEWLPEWLQARFCDNSFRLAAPGEPLVIDGRMGVSSLAEVRSRMMAALLEVDREELNELGIVMRPTSSLVEFPSAGHPGVVPPPTASTVTFEEIAGGSPTARSHSHLPVLLCGAAAVTALACLALWPMGLVGGRFGRPGGGFPAKIPAPPGLPADLPLVEIRPLLDQLPQVIVESTTPPAAAPTLPVTSPVIKSRTQLIPNPAASAGAVPASPEQVRLEIATRRDRLTRLAESRMAAGDSEEALETLHAAVEVARELIAHTDRSTQSVLEMCLLARRAGTLAEGLAKPASARSYYENARTTLLELRRDDRLPKDALRLLAEVETNLRQLGKP